ncbi:penicillin acylase family protein [Streptomyces sp. NPDC013161]|uniref:penicillin acylase family protein n=1 Tax=Streptomyces sp. NPDC013161 TaxID=3364862 RepID=UPI0036ACDC2C
MARHPAARLRRGLFRRRGGEPRLRHRRTPTAGAFCSSFLTTVELTRNGPRAHTLLTYGQSANPASPLFSDQTRLFSRKQWVLERSTQAEISGDPGLEVATLRR